MRIVYLSAGAGGLRCGACAHDFLLVSRLRQLAHEIHVIPAYTPVHTDLGNIGPSTGIFLGGISAYLRVRWPGINSLLRFARPVLDSAPFLDMVTHGMVSTDPHQLGDLTTSVLRGLDGEHAPEIRRLLHKLQQLRPDIVMITNTLFAPLATAIAQQLSLPVVSGFLGEDCFIMDLPEPHRSRCIDLLRRHAANLRAIACPSNAAAQQAALLLSCPPAQLRIVRAPVDAQLYSRPAAPSPSPIPTIGYLSVIRPVKGLDLLLRAVQIVSDTYSSPLNLLIGGQTINADYAKGMRRLAQQLPSNINVEFLGELSLEEKVRMLHRCDLACFPSRIAECRALAAMEAMAAGNAIIAPSHGSFPELLSEGGGWLFEPDSVDQLSHLISAAIADLPATRAQGAAASSHIASHHDPVQIARDLEVVLRDAIHPPTPAPSPTTTQNI